MIADPKQSATKNSNIGELKKFDEADATNGKIDMNFSSRSS